MALKVCCCSAVPKSDVFEEYEIITSSNHRLPFRVIASVAANHIELSTSSMKLIAKEGQKLSASGELFIRNKQVLSFGFFTKELSLRSLQRVKFQIADSTCSPFVVQPQSGTLNIDTTVLIRVFFEPAKPLCSNRQAIILVQVLRPIVFQHICTSYA